MRPHSALWTSYASISKSTGDLRHWQSISDRSGPQSQYGRNSVIRPRGIIRILAPKVDVAAGRHEIPPKEEPVKDDDDADSAISIENGDSCVSPPLASLAISQSGLPHEGESRNVAPKLSMNEGDEKCQPRFYQRRPVPSKRPINSVGSAAAKAKSVVSSRTQGGDMKHLTASGGPSSLPAWKLRKAMKNFKMTRLAGSGGADCDFGAPHIQYFLASLCDHPVSALSTDSKTSIASIDATNKDTSARDNSSMSIGLKARCPLVADVRKLVSKLRSSQPVNAQGYQLSVAVTVLKEFLSGIPGGVFGDLTEEFYQISLESSLELTIMYLHSILHEMPYVVQQFTYLLCKALRNLIRLTGGSSIRNYTDLLMHFTPVLFSSSVGDIDKFLRAARLLLVMVDDCERVFLPLPWLDSNGNWCWHNGDFEDETFFRQIFDSLQNLEARLATDDSGVESEPEESSTVPLVESSLTRRSLSTCSLVDFYQVVYVDDAPEDSSSIDQASYR